MAAMLDGILLDRLAHPPQDQEGVVATLRWLPAGAASLPRAQPGGP
jgi:hypothetical protein